jgi:hypothetical protein
MKEIPRRKQESSGSKTALAKELVDLHIQKGDLEEKEKTIKNNLKKLMTVGDQIEVDDHIVSRISSSTPIVSVEAVKKVLDKEDLNEVIKVSVTELKNFMGQREIEKIADDFQVKDYISVKKK